MKNLVLVSAMVVGFSGLGAELRDPVRVSDGKVIRPEGPGWFQFCGEVLETHPKGIRVRGSFWSTERGNSDASFEETFFVANFPYDVPDGQLVGVSYRYTALLDGTYSYPTVGGSVSKIRRFDYGKIWTPPPPQAPRIATPEEVAAAAAAAKIKKAAASTSAIKYYEALSAKGDSFAWLRLGEIYLRGDGVEKDLVKARDYLTRAARGGRSEAEKLLQSIPPP